MKFVHYKNIEGRQVCIMCEGYHYLYENTTLKDISYYFLPNYSVCLHPKVLFNMFILLRFQELFTKLLRNIRNGFKYLYEKHMEAILFTAKTPVALSMDESYVLFHKLSRMSLNTKFYCIQNSYYGHYWAYKTTFKTMGI